MAVAAAASVVFITINSVQEYTYLFDLQTSGGFLYDVFIAVQDDTCKYTGEQFEPVNSCGFSSLKNSRCGINFMEGETHTQNQECKKASAPWANKAQHYQWKWGCRLPNIITRLLGYVKDQTGGSM